MTALSRGAVIEYPSLFDFEAYPQPYLIISSDNHPFHGEEYLGLAITTTRWDAAISIDDDDWVRGELPKASFVKPWQPTLLKHSDVNDAFGVLRPALVDRAVTTLTRYLRE